MLDQLFDFQREGVEYLAPVKSALIGDEMGLGKTYQAIARDLLIRETHKGSTLIIAPLTVLPTWEEHLKKLTNLDVVTIDPKNRAMSWKQFTTSKTADVFLVHWDVLRMMPELRTGSWLHIIADEVHRGKNRKAQQTIAWKKIKAIYKTGLSGTYLVNRPDEAWSTLNWLYPHDYSSYWRFFNQHVEFEIKYPENYRIIKGPKDVDIFLQKIRPFYIRRRKKEVLKDLPDKYYTDIWVDLLPVQRRAYNQMRKDMIAWVGEHEDKPLSAPVVIAQLTRLQQFAVAFAEVESDSDGNTAVRLAEPSSKLEALQQLLEDNPDEQIVVFSQFKQLTKLVEARLRKRQITYVSLTGDTPQSARGKTVDHFQAGNARVFVGTIGAGGIGITLTASSRVVFLDRSWSPAQNQQAEDRLHRIGQKEAVQVIDIMAKSTVDLGRRQRLEQKWEWIRAMLGDLTASSLNISPKS